MLGRLYQSGLFGAGDAKALIGTGSERMANSAWDYRISCPMKNLLPMPNIPVFCRFCHSCTNDLCTFPSIGSKQVSLFALVDVYNREQREAEVANGH